MITPEEFINIKNNISNLKTDLNDVKNIIAGLKIDKQLIIQSNSIIPPGIACRITYDSKGLILKGEELRLDDIPELPIEKITGLRKILDGKAPSTILDNIKGNSNTDRPKIKAGTGIKINYDENGLVLSSVENLSTLDIPDLPMGKILGLSDRLSMIESHVSNIKKIDDEYSITPGTFTKITYGADGRVISGTKLSMDDLPIDFISRMNIIESRIPILASQQTVDGLSKNINTKLEANKLINSGVFTKVTVDEKGLVTHGDNLTIKDIPEIKINDVTNLASTLRGKAEQSDLVNLMNTVSSLNSSNGSADITSIKNELSSKASNDSLKVLENKIDNTQSLVDRLTEKLPSEFIINQLQDIQDKLSTLTGRVSVIERKLNSPN